MARAQRYRRDRAPQHLSIPEGCQLGEDRAFHLLELGEAAIEGDDFVAGEKSECGQIGIVPQMGGEVPAVGERSPGRFQARWLIEELNARVTEQDVVQLPRPISPYGVGQRPGIIRKSQEALLGHTTEGYRHMSDRTPPRICFGMVPMDAESKCDPDVEIRKQHLLQQRSRRCVR